MSIQQLSTQAQLAQASYAPLSTGLSLQALSEALQAQRDGFAATQAQQFAAKYSVDIGSGLAFCYPPALTPIVLAAHLSAVHRLQCSSQPSRSAGSRATPTVPVRPPSASW